MSENKKYKEVGDAFFVFEEDGDAIEGQYMGSKADMNGDPIFQIRVDNEIPFM